MHAGMHEDIAKVLVSKEVLRTKVKELGAKITEDYEDCDDLIVVCILKGAVVFFSDLIRNINRHVQLDFMSISSYGNFGALVKLLAQIDNQILLLLCHKVLPFQSKKAGRRCFRLPAMSVCSYVFLRCTAGC